MSLISDILLGAASLALFVWCLVLARRLSRFNDLEKGVGGAIAVLSAQVDDMTKTLEAARAVAAHSATSLTAVTERAEGAARRLELLVASLHDLPEQVSAPTPAAAVAPTAPSRSHPVDDAPPEVPLPEVPLDVPLEFKSRGAAPSFLSSRAPDSAPLLLG